MPVALRGFGAVGVFGVCQVWVLGGLRIGGFEWFGWVSAGFAGRDLV